MAKQPYDDARYVEMVGQVEALAAEFVNTEGNTAKDFMDIVEQALDNVEEDE